MIYDVIVIGGGPAGILAAITAKNSGGKVLLIEKNRRLGKKMLISGGGRCNFTNISERDTFISNVPGNGKFLFSALNRFSSSDLLNFMEEELNIDVKVEDEGRVFPTSDKASSVVNSFTNYLKNIDVKVMYETFAEKILIDDNQVKGVFLSNGRAIHSHAVVLATGGLSYPETGSSGDGYEMAESLGHSITEIFPSLVPLVSKDEFILNKVIQGLSLLDVSLSLFDDSNKCITKESGDMLFTHFGISGPAVLRISRTVANLYVKNKKKIPLKIFIDTCPSETEDKLCDRINGLLLSSPKKNVFNGLSGLLPEKLLRYIVDSNELDTKKMNELTKKDITKLINSMKKFVIHISDTRPINEAIVTSGGISIKGVNPKTLESKLIQGLYFAGEVLDVDAFTGGYNIQIAFSTGYVAGKSAVENVLW